MSHPSQAEINEQVKVLFDEIFNRDTPITKKQQLAIPPQMMPAQDEKIRSHNLEEVAIGYSPEQARVEAMRCIQCAKPACISDCPVEINIPGFIKNIADNDFQGAIDIIKETSLLPSICGRVCPQETQCQISCATGKFNKDVDKAVAIGRLERFVADWEREQGTIAPPEVKPETGKKVAIVGSGPAGLVVAADVRRDGHDVTVFEAFHQLGGVMRYGIPEFRLPNSIIDQEVSTLNQMGVKFQKNYVVGRTRKLLDLMKKDNFDSVFVGTGAGLPMFMGIDGENLVGVFSANEYLTRANLMKAYDEEHSDTPFYHSNNVAVLGGGNVAMDSARMALRLGAENVYVVYRRTEKEMPARVEEVEHAKEEGVQFLFLQNAKSIKGDDKSHVVGLECLRYELGEPDDSGRRRPVVIEGSEFMLDLDTVIVAIGNGSNPLVSQTTPELEVNKWGNLIVNDKMKTSVDGVYAGGDIVLGAATVILAMGEGRKAAAAINEYLKE